MNYKELWLKHRHAVIPVVDFTKRCIKNIVDFQDKEHPSSILDYIKLTFDIKENYEIAYNLRDPYSYFNSPKWKLLSTGFLGEIVCKIITDSTTSRFIPAAVEDSTAAYAEVVNGVQFGWVVYDEEVEKIYVHRDHFDKYADVLRELFWNQYPSQHVIIGKEDVKKTVYVREDSRNLKAHYPSKIIDDFAVKIKKYLDYGYNRSFLFYGPPGSGKSNIVKGIVNTLGMRTIRFNNLSELSSDLITDVLQIFQPDAIILEDIDSANVKDVSSLLDNMEQFNCMLKGVFGTANQAHLLSDALIRPGRFDKGVAVRCLDKEVVANMVGNDEELLKVVEDFPAAYIDEVMRRVKVEGREAALADMEDIDIRIKKASKQNYDLTTDDDDEDDDEE